MEDKNRYMYIGLLGTIAFHLILLAAFLILKIGEVKSKHQEAITIEFAEEDMKTVEEIIDNEPEHEAIEQLSESTLSNIASNTADKVNEEINTEKYIEQLKEEMGIEDLNPKYDNTLPDNPTLNTQEKKEKKKPEKTNFGKTRITYSVPPNRKATYIDRPIYRCQGGGEVVVGVVVSSDGHVLQAQIEKTTTNDECIHEMAINSARNFIFERDNAAKKVEGTITYIFVAQ